MQAHHNPNEIFAPTQRTLCRETGLDESEISRALSSGRLKPCRERNGCKYYARADLDALMAEKRARIVARASRLAPHERQKLISELAQENAHLHFRKETNRTDFQAAEERVANAVFTTKIERAERSLAQIEAKLLLRISNLTCRTANGGRLHLRAERIDTEGGVIKAATVLQANVAAVGKFHVTPDGRKLPVFTDAVTLQTLIAAAGQQKIRTREDHVDLVSARAGYTDNFRIVDDRVLGDLHLFRSYKGRDLVLEQAQTAPDLIGLSIDFRPTFEIRDDRALIRVAELYAVDLVDEGAATPSGLFPVS